MTPMMDAGTNKGNIFFDVVVIGSGPAGSALARSLLERSEGWARPPTIAVLEEAAEVKMALYHSHPEISITPRAP